MKGLIVKDLFNLKKYSKSVMLILAFYMLYAVMMDSSMFMAGMIIMLTTMMSITSFSYDDLAKWDKYALSFPITRKEMVLSKYLLALLLSIVGVIIAFAASLLISKIKTPVDMNELLVVSYVLLIVALVFISILLPLIYKFGVEKSRVLIIAVFAVPAAIFFVLTNAGFQMPTESQLMILLQFSPIILLVILFISFYVSVNIYKSKDL